MSSPRSASDAPGHVPTGMRVVVPSRLRVGEGFAIKVKLIGEVHEIAPRGRWNTSKPGLGSPFNVNVDRSIRYMDNCLPQWRGVLRIDALALDGPDTIRFDGEHQGAFPGDRRPIRVVTGYRWTRPGVHFVRIIEPATGLEAWSNPVRVTETPPRDRLYWGDPHWQTFFSDGIRCPEELYAFARDEGFLDFGAISDHMEAITDRQWEYFQAVTNDYNQPGVFVTLQGQEWTHHGAEHGAPGHRNIYFRGSGGPPLRSTDADSNSLPKLWSKLDKLPAGSAIAIPHHPANTKMGVKWELGWNAAYEKAVEIHSVWGSSERSASDGNELSMAAANAGGEQRGRHVIDALDRGYHFGFVGGGDIHDGRPGDELHNESYPAKPFQLRPQGLTAAWVPSLTREDVFDAIAARRTYATSATRVYLEIESRASEAPSHLRVHIASEEGLREAVLVRAGEDGATVTPERDARVIETTLSFPRLERDEYAYLRVVTSTGNIAWSSPIWGDEHA